MSVADICKLGGDVSSRSTVNWFLNDIAVSVQPSFWYSNVVGGV